MNTFRAYNYSVAVLIIIVYLVLPATLFAHSIALDTYGSIPPHESDILKPLMEPVIYGKLSII